MNQFDDISKSVQRLVCEAIDGNYYTAGTPPRVMLPIDDLERLHLANPEDVARLYREIAAFAARNNIPIDEL